MTAVANREVEVFTDMRELPISELRIDPDQIRFELGDGEMVQFAKDLDTHGMLSPVTVMPDGEAYRLICGERRVRAALLAGWKKVPATCLLPLNSLQVIETRFQENQRQKRMTRFEIALVVRELLMRKLNMDAGEVLTLLGYCAKGIKTVLPAQREIIDDILAQSAVAPLEFYKRFMPLLGLEPHYVELIRTRQISERKMLLIKGIPNITQREAILQQTLEEGLTEQQLEGIRRAAVQQDKPKPGKRQRLVRKNLLMVASEFNKLTDDQQIEIEAVIRRLFEKLGLTSV